MVFELHHADPAIYATTDVVPLSHGFASSAWLSLQGREPNLILFPAGFDVELQCMSQKLL